MGGGDGGVLREVVKHPSVESVVQCGMDKDVIQVSRKFLPRMAIGYSSSKLTLHVGDGFEFVKQNQDAFDVILTDSSDPMGPAESLFKESYYQLMKMTLLEDAVLCCQSECQWLHLDLMKEMRQFCQSLFSVVAYAYCTIPTDPSGQIGFMLCSKNLSTNFQEPVQSLTQQQVAQMQLKDHNSDVHRTAFVLPEFARKALNDVSKFFLPTHELTSFHCWGSDTSPSILVAHTGMYCDCTLGTMAPTEFTILNITSNLELHFGRKNALGVIVAGVVGTITTLTPWQQVRNYFLSNNTKFKEITSNRDSLEDWAIKIDKQL
ncbi:hypothetical protein H8959_020891 [Pygathrix nigripes]